jgi:hypothetical protein
MIVHFIQNTSLGFPASLLIEIVIFFRQSLFSVVVAEEGCQSTKNGNSSAMSFTDQTNSIPSLFGHVAYIKAAPHWKR